MTDKIDIYFDERINDRLRGVSGMESMEIILEKYDKIFLSIGKSSSENKKESSNKNYENYIRL